MQYAPSSTGLTSIIACTNIFGEGGTKRKSPENATNYPADKPPAKKGCGKGTKKWKKQELTTILEIVEEHTRCGAKQWDKVVVDLYNAGYKDGRSCEIFKKSLTSCGRLKNPQELLMCLSTYIVQKTSKIKYPASSA